MGLIVYKKKSLGIHSLAHLHAIAGTRCDNYTIELITGKPTTDSCHSYLTKAAEEAGLTEADVHDVWNIFMCTGFTKVQYEEVESLRPLRV